VLTVILAESICALHFAELWIGLDCAVFYVPTNRTMERSLVLSILSLGTCTVSLHTGV